MRKLVLSAIAALLLLAGVVAAQGVSANLMSTLRSQSEFASFVRLIEHAGIHEEFSGAELTVFAPTNGALADRFDRLAALSPDSLELKQFVRSYMVEGAHLASDLTGMALVQNLAGDDLDVVIGTGDESIASADIMNENVEVDDVRLAGAAMEASNGIIYPIDELFDSSLEYVD